MPPKRRGSQASTSVEYLLLVRFEIFEIAIGNIKQRGDGRIARVFSVVEAQRKLKFIIERNGGKIAALHMSQRGGHGTNPSAFKYGRPEGLHLIGLLNSTNPNSSIIKKTQYEAIHGIIAPIAFVNQHDGIAL